MKFQVGDLVTPVSDCATGFNGGVERFLGHIGCIVGWSSQFHKWKVDFKDDMDGLTGHLHTCGGTLLDKTGQNIAERDLELVLTDCDVDEENVSNDSTANDLI